MRKIGGVGLLVFCLWVSWVFSNPLAMADVEWKKLKEIDFQTEPLDLFQSPDGQLLFILTRGEILIYSIKKEMITDRIPVDKEFDRITYSPQTRSLTITSSTKKTLQMISLDFIQNIDISGLSFKGPEAAPVTLAVFMDYQ